MNFILSTQFDFDIKRMSGFLLTKVLVDLHMTLHTFQGVMIRVNHAQIKSTQAWWRQLFPLHYQQQQWYQRRCKFLMIYT